MNNEKEFLGGIRFQFPRDGAPAFIRARGWIDIAEAIAFLQAKQSSGETKINFDINESKDGSKLIGYVDNWKPNTNGGTTHSGAQRRERPAQAQAASAFDDGGFDDSEIPF